MDTVTKESDPQLWEKLHSQWQAEGADRAWVNGPRGQLYKVHHPEDGVVIFAPHGGLDGAYNTRSTKALSNE